MTLSHRNNAHNRKRLTHTPTGDSMSGMLIRYSQPRNRLEPHEIILRRLKQLKSQRSEGDPSYSKYWLCTQLVDRGICARRSAEEFLLGKRVSKIDLYAAMMEEVGLMIVRVESLL